jgi:uncharacterized membrane protein YvbJ
MDQNEIYNYIGLIAILMITLFIFIKAFSYQNKVVETMTNTTTDKDKISSIVDTMTNKINDALLINKYRSNYEDTIVHLEKAVSLSLLSEVINNAEKIASDVTSTESVKTIANLNQLKTFRETLNQTMIILDKN